MNSSLLLVLCVAFSALLGARGAPAPSADEVKYTKCKALSIKLNEMARDLYNKVESPKIAIIIDEPPVSIRPIDTCDPWSLQNNKETCQSRIILALKNYTRIFHKDGVFKNSACSNWTKEANNIANVTGDLLRVLKEPVVDAPLTAVGWHVNALCRDSVERLYSFSIISARVFSFLASLVAPTVEMKQC
uniref:IL-23p19 n=1 Tax=Ctenopharyngodon idella TaxID=7959 RepID=A0A291S0Q1_CTEID|nr:IL-23p19 [Ctenopharyngodon idella]